MTLGEHPDKVDPRFVISLDRFRESEFDIGKFRDIGHLVGGQPLQPGRRRRSWRTSTTTACSTSSSPASTPPQPMAFYRNKGDGTFEDRTEAAGVTGQLGGLYCVPDRLQQRRATWTSSSPAGPGCRIADPADACCGTTATARSPTSPKEAGLLDPVNSNSARLGRLRQRRLARPVRLLRAAAQPPLSQPGRRHLRGGRRQGRRRLAGPDALLQGVRPGSTSTTTAIPTCSSTT